MLSSEETARRDGLPAALSRMTTELVAEATGRGERTNPVLPTTGGPAGNARLTAWTGLLLLALGVIEVITLIDVRGLITWHLVVGALLVPLALLKTATTTWRLARYYAARYPAARYPAAAHRPYRTAGPPPMFLRILGPLVVVSTLGVLGSGLALILLGPDSSRAAIGTVLGQRIDALTLHQACFAVWAVAVGLHVLARLLPALKLAGARRSQAASIPGGRSRVAALVATLLVSVLLAALTVHLAGDWRAGSGGRPDAAPPPQAQRQQL